MFMAWMLLVAVGSPFQVAEIYESVDMIELSHFHDKAGESVFDQLIFYEINPANRKYEIRAWTLIDNGEAAEKSDLQLHHPAVRVSMA